MKVKVVLQAQVHPEGPTEDDLVVVILQKMVQKRWILEKTVQRKLAIETATIRQNQKLSDLKVQGCKRLVGALVVKAMTLPNQIF